MQIMFSSLMSSCLVWIHSQTIDGAGGGVSMEICTCSLPGWLLYQRLQTWVESGRMEDTHLLLKSVKLKTQTERSIRKEYRIPVPRFSSYKGLHCAAGASRAFGAWMHRRCILTRLRRVYYCYTMQWHQSKQGMYWNSVGGDPPHPPSFF